MSRPSWDEYFLDLADLVRRRSTCPRRQVGAVLVRDRRVIATGYNGSVRGRPHCDAVGCLLVDGHCRRTVHAELNALLQCAVYGVASVGATMYCTDSPCLDCAQAMLQARIARLIFRGIYPDASAAATLGEGAIEVFRAVAGEQGISLERQG